MTNQKKIVGNQKKITLVLHLHPNMHCLNPTTPKHKEFPNATKFLYHMAIDHQRIIQSPCDQFLEANQDKIVEEIGMICFNFWEGSIVYQMLET